MLFDNLSAYVDSVENTMCYVRRCEGFADHVLEILGVEIAHCYSKIFADYHMLVAKRYLMLMQYGLRQESQFGLHEQLGRHLLSTISFEAAYKKSSLANAYSG